MVNHPNRSKHNETKHTPEPWSYDGDKAKQDQSRIIKKDGHWIAMACDFNAYSRDAESEANARRIVACVNELGGSIKLRYTSAPQLPTSANRRGYGC